MRTTTKAYRFRGWTFVCAVMLGMVMVTGASTSLAVDPAKRAQQLEQEKDTPAGQRADDPKRADADAPVPGVRDRAQGVRERHGDLGGARIHPWPQSGRWYLGVRVWYLTTGARVTHVFPNTPAWRVGLERDDVIVSIDGYQIGYVNRAFYEISAELNARAGRTGWVRLLVQNCRNDQLVNVDVQLARIGPGFQRQRFDLPPGARLDEGEASEGDKAPRRRPG